MKDSLLIIIKFFDKQDWNFMDDPKIYDGQQTRILILINIKLDN